MSTNELEKLMSAIKCHSREEDVTGTAIPEVSLSRFSSPTNLTAIVYEPCVCVVVQGVKEVLLSGETFQLNAAQMLLVSVDLPVDARVAEATPNEPYLGIRIALDPAVVGELLSDGANTSPAKSISRGLAVTPTEPAFLNAVTRLVGLFDTPNDVDALAPLILREITYRILTGPQGARLRQMASSGAPAQRIAIAIRWIKDHFAEPMRVEMLAKQVTMSSSAFHSHFKSVTSLTPLQYQKRLRLHEARRLMIRDGLDAAEAGFQVGYESPSQFSREYRRQFDSSPRKDVASIVLGNDV